MFSVLFCLSLGMKEWCFGAFCVTVLFREKKNFIFLAVFLVLIGVLWWNFFLVFQWQNNEKSFLQIRFQPNDHKTIKETADELKIFEGIKHPNLVRYFGVELHRVRKHITRAFL